MTGHVLATMNEVISNDFRDGHKALDIVGDGNSDADVISFDEGTVEVVVSDVMYTNHNTRGNATYGNYIMIKHPNGYKTLYAHLKYGSILVQTGDYVTRGQRIATTGDTGNAYGIHLHFEIRAPNNSRVNPYDYLWGGLSFGTDNTDSSDSNMSANVEANSNNGNDFTIPYSKGNSDGLEIEMSGEDHTVVLEGATTFSKISDENDSDFVSNTDYLKNYDYHDGSIVDGLKGIGIDSSFDHREVIANANGISNYRGTYAQNVYLLSLLKCGKLINA